MFKNRSVVMKVVNDKDLPDFPAVTEPVNDTETVIIDVVRESSKYAAGLIAVYMATDTLRKIAIHTAVTKI